MGTSCEVYRKILNTSRMGLKSQEESGDQQHGYDAFRKSIGPSV